ncbi:MAG: hypothetical protein QW483_01795, partial [Nanopusillaceae archaeon]
MSAIKYYSLVGRRAIPVVLPLIALMKQHSFKPEELEITLVVTKESKEVANKVINFLDKHYNLKKFNLVDYDDFLQMTDTIPSEKNVFFNLTSGMNWQVSEVILKLNIDSDITFLYQDYNYLYFISPKYPFGKIVNKLLLPNLGLDNYFELDQEIMLQKKEDNKIELSFIRTYPIIDTIDNNVDKTVIEVLNHKINAYTNDLKNKINRYLVYVKEYRGYLYLYFDFSDFKKTDIENIYRLYRIIISIFNPLNYGLYFYLKPEQNDSITLFENRLATDDIYFTSDRNVFNQWMKNPPSPHKTRPRLESTSTKPNTCYRDSIQKFKEKRVGVVVLGDNITLTLQTIFNWKHVDGFLIIYDSSSERMLYYKEIILRNRPKWILQIGGKFIEFLETNHIGENIGNAIYNFVTNIAKNKKINLEINITPGT